MIKFLKDIQIDKVYLSNFWTMYTHQKKVEICQLVKNVYLMHCFTHKAKVHVPEEMYKDEDVYDHYCEQCQDFTHYSSIMLAEEKYRDVCLSDVCIFKALKEYIEGVDDPIQNDQLFTFNDDEEEELKEEEEEQKQMEIN